MARRDILPGYLSQTAWLDLADAIDVVFASRIDRPIYALRKIRSTRVLTTSGLAKVEDQQLLNPAVDLDVFDAETTTKQVNSSGLIITSKGYFSQQQLARLYRELPKYWYSKGTYRLQDFIEYVLGVPLVITRMWTDDYVAFLPEGDVGIGTPIYQSGTWYPTTHVKISVNEGDLPGGMPLEIFSLFISELLNYYLVPVFDVTAIDLWLASSSTINAANTVLFAMNLHTINEETTTTFAITAAEYNQSNGGGGLGSISGLLVPGTGGTGWVDPIAPVADFSASSTSGAAPLTVTFTNLTTGHQTGQVWDFNDDGAYESTAFAPVYTYTNPGTYTVRLVSTNPFGVDQELKVGYITVT